MEPQGQRKKAPPEIKGPGRNREFWGCPFTHATIHCLTCAAKSNLHHHLLGAFWGESIPSGPDPRTRWHP